MSQSSSNSPTSTAPPKTLVWLDPEQAPVVRLITEAAGLCITHAGSSQLGRSRDVAEQLANVGPGASVEPVDDLRAALLATKADLVLLAAPGNYADIAHRVDSPRTDDSEAIRACRDRGVAIISLEPIPASVLQVLEPSDSGEDSSAASGEESIGLALGPEPTELPPATLASAKQEWATFAPIARLSRPMQDAAEIISQLGTLRMISVQAWSGPGQGSLGARLYDAFDVVVWLLGQPEIVDAAIITPVRQGVAQAAAAQTLRGLEGDACVNMRFADGRAASIVASSRAGRWSRVITLVGENGRVRIYDDGLEWIGADGHVVDATRDPGRIRGSGATDAALAAFVRAASDQIIRRLDARQPPTAPTNVLSVLATAGAALLSARTGQGESPDTILRMARTG